MAVEIVSSQLGLWQDPHWSPGTPGVYALIVGVSAYPHLGGGSAPAPETYGLEQLLSSASTAAALFLWLRDRFRREDLPVVWCHLLLSPTAQERAELDALGLKHYAQPDYLTLHQAIQFWTGKVPKTAPASKNSRTLFFFSGHGVQSNMNALLLPSDYLNPCFGDPQLERCISARELQRWMEESPVAEHLALIDACRNEFSPLASKGATAHGAFPVNPPGGVPRTAASLASASPNTLAYQFPGRSYTFFGQAVLECLRGSADPNDLRVDLRELVDYVKLRVNALLREAGSPLDQTVRPRIDGDDELIVTEVIPPSAAPPFRPGAAPTFRSFKPRPAVALADAENALDSRFDESLAVRDPIPLAALRASPSEAFRRFGHEYASHVWLGGGVALYSLADASPLQGGATVHAVERGADSTIVQVDLSLNAHRDGVLLVFEDAANVQHERLAVALPTDDFGFVPIRLTLNIARAAAAAQPKIQKVEARLGPCDWNPHYEYLWSLTREADLGSLSKAAQLADLEKLKEAAQAKINGPTAATAGMLLLARAGAIAKVRDWPRNLMNWFPWIPDGAVLWAESLRHAQVRGEKHPFGVSNPVGEMAAAIETLWIRGLPFFADSLEILDGVLRYLGRAQLPSERRKRIEDLVQWLERVFRIAMPGGHFLALSGLPRPDWLGGGDEALSVKEMVEVLRRPKEARPKNAS